MAGRGKSYPNASLILIRSLYGTLYKDKMFGGSKHGTPNVSSNLTLRVSEEDVYSRSLKAGVPLKLHVFM